MVKIDEKVWRYFRGDKEVVVATCDEKGVPNAAVKNAAVGGDEIVVWEEVYFTKTYENVKKNPKVCIVGWDRSGPSLTSDGKMIAMNPAYKLVGTATIYDEKHEKTKQWRKRIEKVHRAFGVDSTGVPVQKDAEGHFRHALIEVRIEEIYDQTPGPNAGKKIAP